MPDVKEPVKDQRIIPSEEEILETLEDVFGLKKEDIVESQAAMDELGGVLAKHYTLDYSPTLRNRTIMGAFAPMILFVEVAWADGMIQSKERMILELASGHVSKQFNAPELKEVIVKMLDARPSQEVFDQALKTIAMQINNTPALLRDVATKPFAKGAYKLAAAAGGRMFFRVEEGEKEVLRKFFDALDLGNAPFLERIKKKIR